MRIGEVVELLNVVKNDYEKTDKRHGAIVEACNLLNRLPRIEEATVYEPFKNRVV